ncbi:MAG: Apolipoprotein N-acyltransferase [Candidatus Jettenia ecosi]|uniref:Apolipoprotein N-acyltransferase n=1 Tax=Candidatus Jettenia ecosi TaxID=2494326 RepID=A0A533Q784_9BACT|nr:MAG: Apolipoprotein N-acyltransferase [Candidatus Jettenia ecosi]
MHTTNFLKVFILSFLIIILLCLSFPPADLGYLAWIAFVPWFILIRTEEKYVYLSALFTGAVFFFIQLSWLRHVTLIAWVLLSLYCSAYFVLFTLCTRFIIFKLRLPLVIVAPCLWAALEFIRSFFLSGFPWFFIGHTQYTYLPLIQISDIAGVYGVSFIIITVNACIADFIIFRFIKRNEIILFPDRKFLFFGLIGIFPLVLLTATVLYGLYWLKNYKPQEGPVVCMVQGNIPQDLKFEPTEEDQIDILKKYSGLSMSMKSKVIDLLVWPETMAPGLLNIDPKLTGRKIDMLSQITAMQLAQDLNTHLLLGAIALVLDGKEQRYFNSAYYYSKEGKFIDRYDKIHLVPFGEFTPLKEYFPFLAGMVPYEIGLTHGQRRVLFRLDTGKNGSFTFGSSICYEDTVPSLIRKFKKDGADFMLNITNDGWFRNSAELDQHLAIMVFRAVENRICMARAANTGISSFVAPDGTIYARLTDQNGRYREISGTLTDSIKLIEKQNTIYTNCGDWFSILCATASGIMLLLSPFKKTLSP